VNELPQSVRDRLAKEQQVVPHPDADLLTAFSEGTLSAPERQRTMEHISACGECREVVFLAAPPVEPTQEVVALPSRWRIWSWLAPAVTIAALAVGVGIYVQRQQSNPNVQSGLTATTTKPAPPLSDPTDGNAAAPLRVAPAFEPSRPDKSLAMRTHWRISDAGVLERSNTAGGWEPAFSKSTTEFRVVAVIGAHVWAGGSKGEVFHSNDDGINWKEIDITPSGEHIHAAVTSIKFADERNGSITLADGELWTTTDEGQSWKKR
jgi:hypothetical protein